MAVGKYKIYIERCYIIQWLFAGQTQERKREREREKTEHAGNSNQAIELMITYLEFEGKIRGRGSRGGKLRVNCVCGGYGRIWEERKGRRRGLVWEGKEDERDGKRRRKGRGETG